MIQDVFEFLKWLDDKSIDLVIVNLPYNLAVLQNFMDLYKKDGLGYTN